VSAIVSSAVVRRQADRPSTPCNIDISIGQTICQYRQLRKARSPVDPAPDTATVTGWTRFATATGGGWPGSTPTGIGSRPNDKARVVFAGDYLREHVTLG
jgi:hypothetical protein